MTILDLRGIIAEDMPVKLYMSACLIYRGCFYSIPESFYSYRVIHIFPSASCREPRRLCFGVTND